MIPVYSEFLPIMPNNPYVNNNMNNHIEADNLKYSASGYSSNDKSNKHISSHYNNVNSSNQFGNNNKLEYMDVYA